MLVCVSESVCVFICVCKLPIFFVMQPLFHIFSEAMFLIIQGLNIGSIPSLQMGKLKHQVVTSLNQNHSLYLVVCSYPALHGL